eukprot:CAMPEP_0181237068 /NCGR_PEP_ID=MMETSP1096-20121128/38548_1 /TAXON_ID=156174 ORGANISM="Chrysochromulina ericina, Strain CCMP281" /NCGR_SAMPLE_ID=MMETSP1096 /ASSEMBLY_ACC=CAM_ASM_000453 /LENGTH=64 /DNA_ID=CAMNT_0023332363 /DNA_START=11 /DNA_END=205 /DNA_ORIENTATION=+
MTSGARQLSGREPATHQVDGATSALHCPSPPVQRCPSPPVQGCPSPRLQGFWPRGYRGGYQAAP